MAAQFLPRHRSMGWKVQVAAIAGAVLVCTLPVHAQLDPLLFLKRIPPNVLLVVDTRASMLNDADGTYYDPVDYAYKNAASNALWQTALGITTTNNYRRKYLNFAYTAATTVSGFTYNYQSASIATVGDDNPSGYSSFYARTRLEVARAALKQVVSENSKFARFGLI